jgi:hypothetical protein
MKTFLALMLLALATLSATAQEKTLLQGEVENGGFGGPAVQFTSINDHLGVLVGGGGGWIINHSVVVGGFGYGLANEITGRPTLPDSSLLLNFGYGGIYLAYIHNSDALLHFTIHAIVGAGGIDYRRSEVYQNHNGELDNNPAFRTDAVFAVEPGISLEINVAKNFRIDIMGSYRFISDVDLEGVSNSSLSGASAGMLFKFGAF